MVRYSSSVLTEFDPADCVHVSSPQHRPHDYFYQSCPIPSNANIFIGKHYECIILLATSVPWCLPAIHHFCKSISAGACVRASVTLDSSQLVNLPLVRRIHGSIPIVEVRALLLSVVIRSCITSTANRRPARGHMA